MLFYNKELEPLLGEWCKFLPDSTLDLGYNIYEKVNSMRGTYKIYPEKEDTFKVFKEISPSNVKVVILGQD